MDLRETNSFPADLRAEYVRSLPEAQELFVEGLVQASAGVLFVEGERVFGHAAVHEHTLVEFFVREDDVLNAEAAFEAVCARFAVTSVLCKTFDTLLMAVASGLPSQVKTVGYLFRRLTAPALMGAGPVLASRRAGAGDVERLLEVHEGFFDSPAELEGYLRDDGLTVYESPGGSLLGCGLVKRITPWQDAFDLGMLVARAHRGQGLGARIIEDLTARCLAAGHRPVCGCDVENLASRRSLERAGFRTVHRLLELRFGRPVGR